MAPRSSPLKIQFLRNLSICNAEISMGWLDYHLHLFSLLRIRLPRKRKLLEIGIPTDDYYDEPLLPGWEIHISEYFTEPGKSALYRYDFGDGWDHHVFFEGILLKEEEIRS